MSSREVAEPLVVRALTAAEMLGCSRAHVYQLIERGHLRRVQLPGSKAVRIPIGDVRRAAGLDPYTGLDPAEAS